MGHPPIEELLPKADFSVYKLVRLAADRAIELADGKKPLVETRITDKTATIALEEIRRAKVVLKDVARHFQALNGSPPKGGKKEAQAPAGNAV